MYKAILSVLLLSLVACSSAPYKTDFDYREGIDFGKYKYFSWMASDPVFEATPQSINPLVEQRILNAAMRALELRGYSYVSDAKDADLVVAFSVGSREKIRVTSYPEPYRRAYGWGGAYYGYYAGGTSTNVRQYTEGTLAMDIFDAELNQPVYHASASGVMKNRTREEQEALLDQLMMDLTANFPQLAVR